jgi:uncharacterized protein YbjQ (UPF0145 family)
MRVAKIITALFFLTILVGCATGSSIVTGKAIPATSLRAVKIYIDPPSQYETIGLVEASSDVELSTQAAQDRAINELKSQAAKIGANGVLLMTAGDKSGGMVGFYSGGIFYAGTTDTKIAQGRAIFVIQE